LRRSARLAALALAQALALLAVSCATVPAPVVAPGEAPPPQVTSPGPASAPSALKLDGEPAIDVGLAWDLDSLVVTAAGASLGFPCRSMVHAADGAVRVAVADGGMRWEFQEGGREVRDEQTGCRSDTIQIGSRTGRPLAWNGKTWRGSFRIFLNPRGKLTLVDRLPLETYLLGVVPGEIGGLSRELIEAGCAQAIAARSYTLFYRGRRASEGFDLYGTVEDQVYGPVESERPLATESVEKTRGQVALYDGQPIRANYCGISAEAWEAWPTPPFPYLASRRDRERDDDFCAAAPQYRWRERWSPEEFLADLARYGPQQSVPLPAAGSGALVDARVEARSTSGRVWRLRVRTTTGDVVIPAYSIRQVLRRSGTSGALLRSNLFKIDVRRDPATGRALEVVASGAGAGHGVGLCQTGALGMARSGAKADAILEHYYPHAGLRRLY